MKKAVLIVLLLLSAAALVFVYNDDFLYSQQIMKLTKIETVGEEISRNNLDLKEEHYTRRITMPKQILLFLCQLVIRPVYRE